MENLRAKRDSVEWNPQYECYGYIKNGKFQKLAGIEKRLKKVFGVYIGRFKKTSRSDPRVVGRAGGRLVHRQIEKCIGLLTQGQEFEKAIKAVKKMTPDARIVLETIRERKWKPLYSEYAIGDISSGLGTALDLLCLDPKGKLHNIELKTGYNGNFDTGDKELNLPISVMNSPCSLALLQVMMGEMFLNQYGITHVESHVWRLEQGSESVILDERHIPPSLLEQKELVFRMAIAGKAPKSIPKRKRILSAKERKR